MLKKGNPTRSIKNEANKKDVLTCSQIAQWLLTERKKKKQKIAKAEIKIERKKRNQGKNHTINLKAAEGFEDLDSNEIKKCTELRLMPKQYSECKKILLDNWSKMGFYKKSAAQKMLRIDVNKTGKLYDYFSKRGWMK